jgi:hypothetical protein
MRSPGNTLHEAGDVTAKRNTDQTVPGRSVLSLSRLVTGRRRGWLAFSLIVRGAGPSLSLPVPITADIRVDYVHTSSVIELRIL